MISPHKKVGQMNYSNNKESKQLLMKNNGDNKHVSVFENVVKETKKYTVIINNRWQRIKGFSGKHHARSRFPRTVSKLFFMKDNIMYGNGPGIYA